jgi:lipoprotein-anchoring transpeptidase ErfK/SrfK
MRRLAAVTILATAALLAVPATAGARNLSMGMCGPDVHRLQHRLGVRSYLPLSYTPGCFTYRTQQAVMAFQGWARLTRSGVANWATRHRLRASSTPVPWTGTRHFRHFEIHKRRQVLIVVGKLGRVLRTIHVSTAAAGHVTPTGHWHVYSKSKMSWSNLFHVWLPWASYVVGGIAMHEYPDVPGYPASHGCIRIGKPEARWVYGKAPIGTPVWIK